MPLFYFNTVGESTMGMRQYSFPTVQYASWFWATVAVWFQYPNIKLLWQAKAILYCKLIVSTDTIKPKPLFKKTTTVHYQIKLNTHKITQIQYEYEYKV